MLKLKKSKEGLLLMFSLRAPAQQRLSRVSGVSIKAFLPVLWTEDMVNVLEDMVNFICSNLPEKCSRARIIKQLHYEGIHYEPPPKKRCLHEFWFSEKKSPRKDFCTCFLAYFLTSKKIKISTSDRFL